MGGGCLGTPEILREPYGGEFSFPFTGPVLAPCNLMGEGVPGNREKLPSSGATVGTPGSPVSHRSSLLSPVVPLSSFLFSLPILPLGLHYLLPTELLPDLSPVSASSMLCLWVLPPSFLSPVTVSATLGLPSPPRFPHPPHLPGPTPPTSFSALKGKNIHVSLTSSGPPVGQTSLCICLPWTPLRPLSLGTLLVASWPEKHLHVSLWLCFFL